MSADHSQLRHDDGHAEQHHAHEHEHDHGHGHATHDHGLGVFGWLRGQYGHSHSIAEKTDSAMESNERGIRALKISLVALGITATLQLIIVLLSGSVALLADTIHNFGDAATSVPLWIA